MDFTHYVADPVDLAVDLVNTREIYNGVEHLQGPADVEAFLRDHSEGWSESDTAIRPNDVDEIRALRERLRAVFDAPDEQAAALRLNEVLGQASAVPRIRFDGGTEAHLHFEPESESVAHWLGAVAGMGLSLLFVEEGLTRFGVCASSTCEDVFVDTSRNRSRRHCSDTCTTRENVAAYRRRHRSEGE